MSKVEGIDFGTIIRDIYKLDDVKSMFSISLKLIELMSRVVGDAADACLDDRIKEDYGYFCPEMGKELDDFFKEIVDECEYSLDEEDIGDPYIPSGEELAKLSACRSQHRGYVKNFDATLSRLKDSIKEQNKSAANIGEPPLKKAKKNK